jgi:hypothetical protein
MRSVEFGLGACRSYPLRPGLAVAPASWFYSWPSAEGCASLNRRREFAPRVARWEDRVCHAKCVTKEAGQDE